MCPYMYVFVSCDGRFLYRVMIGHSNGVEHANSVKHCFLATHN